MKTRFLTGFVIAAIIILSLSTIPVYAHTIYPTPEEFYDNSDLIVLGKIISTDKSKPEMKYQIQVKEFVKNTTDNNSAILDAYGCNPSPPSGGAVTMGCQFFEKDQNVFLGLHKDDHGQLLLGLGFQVQNQNCTGEQLLHAVDRVTGIQVLQNGKPKPLLVGQKTDVVYDALNTDMLVQNFTVTFHVFRANDVAKNDTHFETMNIQADECQMHNIISYSFIPHKSGRYSFDVQNEGIQRLSVGGITIIDSSLAPLKQIKTGIGSQDVWCKDGLFLILKNDNTKPRYDNFPACVTNDTATKLVQRNWGFVPPESQAYRDLGEKNEN